MEIQRNLVYIGNNYFDIDTGEKMSIDIISEYGYEAMNRAIIYRLDTVLVFGRYRGDCIGDILLNNSGYIRWMLREGFNIDSEVLDALDISNLRQKTIDYIDQRRKKLPNDMTYSFKDLGDFKTFASDMMAKTPDSMWNNV